MDNLIDALNTIPVSDLNYGDWVKVGQALHAEGYPCSIWDNWSANDTRYKAGECERKWQGFGKTNTTEVTGGTIVEMAKAYGYTLPDMMEVFDWDSEIQSDWAPGDGTIVKDKAWLDLEDDRNQLKLPAKDEWNESGDADEIIDYVSTLFKPDDIVSFVFSSQKDAKDGKWKPSDHGVSFKASELLANLQKAKNKDGDVTRAVFTYEKEAGMWIRPNPMDGEGYSNKNVKEFRYALLESDNLPIPQQIAIIREMQIPVKILVYSGGKSVHAIVKIDAPNEKIYRQRVDRLYAECKKNQFDPDEINKNASRLSRLPGVYRGKNKQYILDKEIGQPSWQAWEDFLAEAQDTLPDVEDLDKALDSPHELTPVLIGDTLRQSHKMLIAGPSKAGKSFLLMELAVAISAGQKWIGKRCAKGEVLYVNLEIDRNSFLNRFDEIYQKKGIDRKKCEKVHIWNLRGKTPPLDTLTPRLIRRVRDRELKAIIIDPIYKVITGDENNARDMAKFCNFFDQIATETGASLIYVHHHSKGSQAGKRSMDRASGSGVFARDPDALLDMIELSREDGDGDKTAWRIEATLREFKPWAPIDVWFDFPIHEVDEEGELHHRTTFDPIEIANAKKVERKEFQKVEAVKAYDDLTDWGDDGWVKIDDIAAQIGSGSQTVKKYFKEMEEDFDYRAARRGPKAGSWVKKKRSDEE